MPYLVIEGVGNPSTSRVFQEAIQALYSAAYTMKFGAKFAGLAEWKVTALEVLWWDTSGRDRCRREGVKGQLSGSTQANAYISDNVHILEYVGVRTLTWRRPAPHARCGAFRPSSHSYSTD